MKLTVPCVFGTLLAFSSISWIRACDEDDDEVFQKGQNIGLCVATLKPQKGCTPGERDGMCPYLLHLPPLTVHLPPQFRDLEKLMGDLQKLKASVDELRGMCANCSGSRTGRECGKQKREREELDQGKGTGERERNWVHVVLKENEEDFKKECGDRGKVGADGNRNKGPIEDKERKEKVTGMGENDEEIKTEATGQKDSLTETGSETSVVGTRKTSAETNPAEPKRDKDDALRGDVWTPHEDTNLEGDKQIGNRNTFMNSGDNTDPAHEEETLDLMEERMEKEKNSKRPRQSNPQAAEDTVGVNKEGSKGSITSAKEKIITAGERDGEVSFGKTSESPPFVSTTASHFVIRLSSRADSMDSNKTTTFTSSVPLPPLPSFTLSSITDVRNGTAAGHGPTRSTGPEAAGDSEPQSFDAEMDFVIYRTTTEGGPVIKRTPAATDPRSASSQGPIPELMTTSSTTRSYQEYYTTLLPGIKDNSPGKPLKNNNTKTATKLKPHPGQKTAQTETKTNTKEKPLNPKHVSKSDLVRSPAKKPKPPQKLKPVPKKPAVIKLKPAKDTPQNKNSKPAQKHPPSVLSYDTNLKKASLHNKTHATNQSKAWMTSSPQSKRVNTTSQTDKSPFDEAKVTDRDPNINNKIKDNLETTDLSTTTSANRIHVLKIPTAPKGLFPKEFEKSSRRTPPEEFYERAPHETELQENSVTERTPAADQTTKQPLREAGQDKNSSTMKQTSKYGQVARTNKTNIYREKTSPQPKPGQTPQPKPRPNTPKAQPSPPSVHEQIKVKANKTAVQRPRTPSTPSLSTTTKPQKGTTIKQNPTMTPTGRPETRTDAPPTLMSWTISKVIKDTNSNILPTVGLAKKFSEVTHALREVETDTSMRKSIPPASKQPVKKKESSDTNLFPAPVLHVDAKSKDKTTDLVSTFRLNVKSKQETTTFSENLTVRDHLNSKVGPTTTPEVYQQPAGGLIGLSGKNASNISESREKLVSRLTVNKPELSRNNSKTHPKPPQNQKFPKPGKVPISKLRKDIKPGQKPQTNPKLKSSKPGKFPRPNSPLLHHNANKPKSNKTTMPRPLPPKTPSNDLNSKLQREKTEIPNTTAKPQKYGESQTQAAPTHVTWTSSYAIKKLPIGIVPPSRLGKIFSETGHLLGTTESNVFTKETITELPLRSSESLQKSGENVLPESVSTSDSTSGQKSSVPTRSTAEASFPENAKTGEDLNSVKRLTTTPTPHKQFSDETGDETDENTDNKERSITEQTLLNNQSDKWTSKKSEHNENMSKMTPTAKVNQVPKENQKFTRPGKIPPSKGNSHSPHRQPSQVQTRLKPTRPERMPLAIPPSVRDKLNKANTSKTSIPSPSSPSAVLLRSTLNPPGEAVQTHSPTIPPKPRQETKAKADVIPSQISRTSSSTHINTQSPFGLVQQFSEVTHPSWDAQSSDSRTKTSTESPETVNHLETGPSSSRHNTLHENFPSSPSSRVVSDLRPQTDSQPLSFAMTTSPSRINTGMSRSVPTLSTAESSRPSRARKPASTFQIPHGAEDKPPATTFPSLHFSLTSLLSPDLRSAIPANSGLKAQTSEPTPDTARELRVKINQMDAFLNSSLSPDGRAADRHPNQHPEAADADGEKTDSKHPRTLLLKAPRDCSDLLLSGKTKNGVYMVTPDPRRGSFPVFCEMERLGGGWTLLQRRQDGSVSFNRTWAEYRSGFGELDGGEFWLGNNPIHLLTRDRNMVLRVELEDFEGASRHAQYAHFRVAGERLRFRLTVDGYSGDAGDALRFSRTYDHNNKPFTAPDRDNDRYPSGNCGAYYSSGWWFDACMAANLNGRYYSGPYKGVRDGIFWGTWHNITREYYPTNDRLPFKTVQMMINPKHLTT